MVMVMRKLKGFALRRPGHPRGSKSFQGAQNDFWPLEKLLAQCGWQSRPASERGSPAPPQAAAPRLLTGGERLEKASSEEMGDFCEF